MEKEDWDPVQKLKTVPQVCRSFSPSLQDIVIDLCEVTPQKGIL